jgi:hypothetical protein
MPRRPVLLLPAVLAALALPVAPALAGEDDDSATAQLRVPHGCVSGDRAKIVVTGDEIDSVGLYVDGDHIRTLTRPDADGRYTFSMKCSRLSVGAHTARAIAWFTEGSSPASQSLRFQLSRARQGSPRFAG